MVRRVLIPVVLAVGCAKSRPAAEMPYTPTYLRGGEAFQLAGDTEALLDLSKEYRVLVSEWLTGDPARDADIRTRAAGGLQAFEAAVFVPMRAEDFTVASGARFLLASGYLYYAALGLAEEPPPGLPPHLEAAYRASIDAGATPYREAEAHAVMLLRSLVDVADATGDGSVWVDRARGILDDLGADPTPPERVDAR